MISFIVPTVGRLSLVQTLQSIECWPDDEILIVGDKTALSIAQLCYSRTRMPPPRLIECEKGHDYGHTERNYATPFAAKKYVCHIDDDDVYASGARAAMQDAIERTPDRPVLFRMRAPNGVTLWHDKVIRCGNVGTPIFLLPNKPEMFGRWEPFVGGDCAFLESCKWKAEDYVWREEVVCLVGHNWG